MPRGLQFSKMRRYGMKIICDNLSYHGTTLIWRLTELNIVNHNMNILSICFLFLKNKQIRQTKPVKILF